MSYDSYYQDASTLADSIIASTTPSPANTAGEAGRRRGIAARTASDTKERLKAASDTGLKVADNSQYATTQSDVAARYIAALRSEYKPTPEAVSTNESLGDTVEVKPGRWLEGGDINKEAMIKAIKDIESSGGDYSARGPVIKEGDYKGQRAMGAYQVMPGNLAEWSKEALGKSVTEEQFMASPEIQDAIFLHRMGKAKEKYGTLEDAVSVWFSGQPLATAGNASDSYLTTPEYVSKFQNNYNMYSNNAR